MWHSSYMAISLRFGVPFADAAGGLALEEDAPEYLALKKELGSSRKEERAYALAQGLARIVSHVEREVIRK